MSHGTTRDCTRTLNGQLCSEITFERVFVKQESEMSQVPNMTDTRHEDTFGTRGVDEYGKHDWEIKIVNSLTILWKNKGENLHNFSISYYKSLQGKGPVIFFHSPCIHLSISTYNVVHQGTTKFVGIKKLGIFFLVLVLSGKLGKQSL